MPPQHPHLQHSQHQQPPHHQKSQTLPQLRSPRPPSLTPNSNDQTEQSENDHDQIIDQVISLENEFSDNTNMLAGLDSSSGLLVNHPVPSHHQHQQSQTQPLRQHQQQQQQQQPHPQQSHHMGDINMGGGIGGNYMPDGNQFSSSSEDLLNLLLEFDGEPSHLIGLDNSQALDQDEKVGIENIRKQLMSCEVQSEQQHNPNSMSIVNQMSCQPQKPRPPHHTNNSIHQPQQVAQQLLSPTAPVITHHQPIHQMPTSVSSQLISSDQSILHGSYSSVPMGTVPVSPSGQPYIPQQPQQQTPPPPPSHVTRISQSNPMSIVNNSPSPSWQQPQLSPYSPQPQHNNARAAAQRQGHPMHPQMQQLPTSPSPQMQQLHHQLQQRSPSQSVSPPATSEPSPVVKKNPLLNAQLVNSRAPSIAPNRFMSQTNVLNQNPILNAKLSQSSFVANTGVPVVGSPVNSTINPHNRFITQNQPQTNFNYDLNQPQQQTPPTTQHHNPQIPGHLNMYGPNDQSPQSSNSMFRTPPAPVMGSPGVPIMNTIGTTSSSGGVSQQVKQEIRRKVQQPKQQQQTTSLLKQLLSDDNK